MSTITFAQFLYGEIGQESGGNYAAKSPAGALGKYQILSSNIASWSKEILGYSISPDEFLQSPQLQDEIAIGKFYKYFKAYGAEGAASAWYTGNPDAWKSGGGGDSYGGPAASGYVQQVISRAMGYKGNGSELTFNKYVPHGTETSGVNGSYTPTAGGAVTQGTAPGGVVDAKHTAADYKSALGDLAGLLTAVPELKGLLDTAIAKNQAPEDFANAIQSSKWYKQHNAATRSLVALQYSDPAEYQAKLRTQRTMIEQQAAKLGVQMGPGRLEQLVHQSIVEGWDQQTLTNNLGQTLFNPKNPNQKLTGDIASAYQQMKQVYAAYGVAATDATLRNNALRIAEGMTTLDAYRTNVIQAAKSQYPGLSTQLDQGLTVADVAQPYQSSMAQLLEVDPATLGLTTPLIRQALQGKAGASADGKSTVPTSQPLWQFENQVRQDPRWALTDNAHQQISTQLLQIGRDFGFAS